MKCRVSAGERNSTDRLEAVTGLTVLQAVLDFTQPWSSCGELSLER